MEEKLRLAPDLAELHLMTDYLLERCGELSINEKLCRMIQAGAIQGFGAVCVAAPAGETRVYLELVQGDAALSIRFLLPPGVRPLGLAPALYCPPAARVSFRRDGETAEWKVFWEV